MLNAPISPAAYQPVPQVSNPQVQNPAPQPASTASATDPKTVLKEQSLAISSDICAEYGAVTRLNDILVSYAKTAKEEKNPEEKKIMEARINTINQMILQREMKINQMEIARAQIDAQLKAQA